MATTYPDLPTINPDEHRFYIAKNIPSEVSADETQIHRYVRTTEETVKLGLGLDELLKITDEELDRLRDTGTPVTPYQWCYYPREAALEGCRVLPNSTYDACYGRRFLEITSAHLKDLVREDLLLAARVDVVDRRTRHGAPPTAEVWMTEYFRTRRQSGEYRLSDLAPDLGNIKQQFLYGQNRATGVVAEWLVDIEPLLEKV